MINGVQVFMSKFYVFSTQRAISCSIFFAADVAFGQLRVGKSIKGNTYLVIFIEYPQKLIAKHRLIIVSIEVLTFSVCVKERQYDVLVT